MRTTKNNTFQTIRSEGGLLPADLLQRLSGRDKDIPGVTDSSYHLSGERLNEAINRSWNRLSGAWTAFQEALEKLPEAEPATSITREKWLLPLFEELKYGRLQTSKAQTIDSKSYPVSHGWGHLPIHLIGARVGLDQRSQGVAGASRSSPHSMVQEFLNRSDDHLWAIVSNGLQLRILRDNITLTRQAFLEFDLAAMFDGESYADFAVLWLVCHQSRVEAENPNLCWLEKWSQFAEESGTRALEKLREGVEQAIVSLGRGFLAHPANTELRQKLSSGEIDKQDYYRQLLRLIYRFIFLFVAEDRQLLLQPDTDKSAKRHYDDYYSLSRLRNLAERRIATQHVDLWKGLTLLFDLLDEKGCPALGLPALGSFLWSAQATPTFDGAVIANRDLLRAIYRLAFVQDGSVRRSVDYRNLGAEELGSIYEALLEMHPQIDLGAKTFALATAAGNERKTTGSYYTPTSLVNCLLDSALDPVIAQAAKSEYPEQALLDLKICDPACGSGHFLIAAAHRLAKRLATVRTGDEEPSPEETSKALRDVIGRCIFGVDINPMAVELCKVSLWMEAIEPGKPLSFLDHHIQCGNSLLGATPALISRGIPDAAFKPITGDDKAIAAAHKKDNKDARKEGEKKGQELLDFAQKKAPWEQLGNIPKALCELEARDDSDLDAVRAKEAKYRELVRSSSYENAYLLADAWCAAFVYPKDADHEFAPLHTGELLKIERNPHSVNPNLRAEIKDLADRYQFLHWHLAFPQVFQPIEATNKDDILGWEGGFDCVLGNPPWERVKLQEKEWFAERDAEIANASNASTRKKRIQALKTENPALWDAFQADLRKAEGESHIIRNSERYPLCGRGDVNTYTIFAEGNRQAISRRGRAGFIVPSGIATDDTTKFYFQDIIGKRSLVSLYDFENRDGIFEGVHRSYKFCLLTLAGPESKWGKGAEFVFFAHQVEQLFETDRRFMLTAEEIELLNPNTRTCPIFRSRADAELTKAIYRRVSVLIKEARDSQPEENPWGIKFGTMFHMTNDADLFETRDELDSKGLKLHGNIFKSKDKTWLPLYEGRMGWQFNHRYSSFENGDYNTIPVHDLNDTKRNALPQYWVSSSSYYETSQYSRKLFPNDPWLGFRRVSSNTNERFVVASLIPNYPSSYGWILSEGPSKLDALKLLSAYNSFNFDYLARNAIGQASIPQGSFAQLPVPIIKDKPLVTSNTIELVNTANDLFREESVSSYVGPPFRWDEVRRFLIRCELDAIFFHLYLPADDNGDWKPAHIEEGAVVDETEEQLAELKQHFPTPRDAVAYIMETFPIVKRKDTRDHGHYRTKDTILEIYDAMLEAQRTGQPYQTRLDPPPGDIRAAHLPELPTTVRAAFPKSSDYVNFLVYALIGRSIGGCSLKVMTRAFNLLRGNGLSVSTLPEIPSDLIEDWSKSFNQKLSQGDLSVMVKQLVERGALSTEESGDDLILKLEVQEIPDIPPWIGVDADLSLRAALTDISSQPELTQAEEAEYSTIYEYAQSA
ncbi:MAG: N-6 DNA methylase [Verrucomicrobia bacterium]|jgi:hypothetical protein|nr:N-6 DNA methylase [Verrucomicrobiota bacterium]